MQTPRAATQPLLREGAEVVEGVLVDFRGKTPPGKGAAEKCRAGPYAGPAWGFGTILPGEDAETLTRIAPCD